MCRQARSKQRHEDLLHCKQASEQGRIARLENRGEAKVPRRDVRSSLPARSGVNPFNEGDDDGVDIRRVWGGGP